ncbi:TetR family transcriptional regulator [Streptomyces sp. NPDC003023]|uniref:TetR family transcriptional regulator n=1 Tax=Streptomyces sp. NPDC003023 TaxID=3364675 RepID=UPI0036AFB77E
MTKQDRALRTRTALIRAAATEFERSGYAGASMHQITRTAGMSTGALTFHFDSKGDVADAVVERARGVVGAVLDDVRTRTEDRPPMERLGALVVALARTVYEDVEVRGAARLEQERPDEGPTWSTDWYPAVCHLAGQAHSAGDTPATARPGLVAALAALFIRSADTYRRTQHPAADGSLEEFVLLWAMAQRGILAADPGPCAHPSRAARNASSAMPGVASR